MNPRVESFEIKISIGTMESQKQLLKKRTQQILMDLEYNIVGHIAGGLKITTVSKIFFKN